MPAVTPPIGKLRLHRETGPRGKFESYAVYIDDKKVREINEGDTIEIVLPPSRYRVCLKVASFWTSPTLDVEVEAGLTVDCRCRAGGSAGATVTDTIFHRHNFIELVGSDTILPSQRSLEREVLLRFLLVFGTALVCMVIVLPICIGLKLSPHARTIVSVAPIGIAIAISMFSPLGRRARLRDRNK